jgi:hypothetical protein
MYLHQFLEKENNRFFGSDNPKNIGNANDIIIAMGKTTF